MNAYVHQSTAAAASFLAATCTQMGLTPVVSSDPNLFNKRVGNKVEFDVIVFVQNSGDLFDPVEGAEYLQSHISAGKGVLGVHAALASFLDDEDASGAKVMKPTCKVIQDIFGAHFENHPPVQTGVVRLDSANVAALDSSHGYLATMPQSFCHTDEFFNYTVNPSDSDVTVLASVDETSYTGGSMGANHPVVWHRRLGPNKAPVFYCALGHFEHFYNGLGGETVANFIKAGMAFCCEQSPKDTSKPTA